MDARTHFVFWMTLIGVFLRLISAQVGIMIDPVAYLGLAFAILFPFLQWRYEKTPQWVADLGIGIGCIVFGIGLAPLGTHLDSCSTSASGSTASKVPLSSPNPDSSHSKAVPEKTTSRTPEYFGNILKNHNEIQIGSMIKPYFGIRMFASAKIITINKLGYVALFAKDIEIVCVYSPDQLDYLGTLDIGQTVNLSGVIESTSGSAMTLTACRPEDHATTP